MGRRANAHPRTMLLQERRPVLARGGEFVSGRAGAARLASGEPSRRDEAAAADTRQGNQPSQRQTRVEQEGNAVMVEAGQSPSVA